ncbi:hypothetical protein KUTeg_000221 [Tegillarca granosa]|uniref:VWFA domain-containing protein n=1 Tax=Tegillarca granosa TaxID=220873 RepID=A0ABQ9G1B2_TEGGR|nr:hypothetical protein KUTeg_000221 [Tegillarca granosa]
MMEGVTQNHGNVAGNAKYPPRSVIDVMKKNYDDNNNILWQYFGSEDGTYINYPAVKLKSCDYDPRFRPYYATGASPKPKDVVLTIDTSNSMTAIYGERSLMQIAKEAAITVVKTLNANDRVGVVSFNTFAHTPIVKKSACYSTKLATATAINIDEVTDYINRLSGSGETNYEDALLKSFSYFSQSSPTLHGEDRERVILFLTDGKNDKGGDPLAIIRDENQKLNNSVVILTYGLGTGLPNAALTLLSNMSQQVLNSDTYGEVKKGRFKHITNPNNLRREMGSYYYLLSHQERPEASHTVPYIDLFSKIGLLTSVCLPAYQNGEIIGVACIDMKLSDLQSDMNYTQDDITTYTFLIDGYGRTLIHPLLPQPRGITTDVVLVDIHHFERSLDLKIVNDMKRGVDGDITIDAQRILPRGYMVEEGMTSRLMKSHYTWKKVNNSNYTVCVAVGDNDTSDTPNTLEGKPGVFAYHRRDLGYRNLADCKHYARVATKDSSLVMLTASAYKEPTQYLDQNETEASVTRYENYFNGASIINPGFKDTVLTSVVVTHKAEVIWMRNRGDAIIWRYIVTTDGVLRMYPGVKQAKEWDHKERHWYWRTTSQSGKYIFSAPYEDLWGAGYLITISHTIYQGRSNLKHESTDKVKAVMAVDISIHYFYQMVLRQYKLCNSTQFRCFVIDNSGFFVIHPDFTNHLTNPDLDKSIHITAKEGDIARDLISKGILTKRSCTDFQSIKDHITYRVVLTSFYKNGVDMEDRTGYEMKSIRNSNIFLIIKRNDYIPTQCCNLIAYQSPSNVRCSNNTGSCECLCFRDINFNYCLNEYQSRDASPICSATTPNYNVVFEDEEKKLKGDGLQICFDPKCDQRVSAEICYNVAGCSWCNWWADETRIKPSFCNLNEICPFGKCKDDMKCQSLRGVSGDSREITTIYPTEIQVQNNILPIALGVGGFVLVIIIIVIVVVFGMYKRKQTSKKNEYLNAIYVSAVSSEIDYQPKTCVNNQNKILQQQDQVTTNTNDSHLDKGHYCSMPGITVKP